MGLNFPLKWGQHAAGVCWQYVDFEAREWTAESDRVKITSVVCRGGSGTQTNEVSLPGILGELLKNILFLSPTPSHPQTQGNRRRIYEVCQRFKQQGYAVHFVWLASEWRGVISYDALTAMRDAWDHVHVVPHSGPDGGFGGTLDALWTKSLEDMVGWLRLNFEYEVVWAHYVLLSKVCEIFADEETVAVVDTHDVLGDRDAIFKPFGRKSDFASLTREEEKRGLARADFAVACQPEDEEYFKREYGLQNTLTIGQIQHATAVPERKGTGKTVGFIGSQNAVNVESLKQLVAELEAQREVLPKDFRLRLAGSMTRGADIHLPDFVEDCGYVDNLAEFYASVDLMVLPLEFGTGLKVKSVEAVSFGVPVLGTEHAFIGLVTDEPLHQFQTVKSLVQAIPAVLASVEERARLAAISSAVFKDYQMRTEEQFRTFDRLKDERLASAASNMRQFDSAGVAVNTPFYIYGAGMGGKIVFDALVGDQRAMCMGFIDAHKAGTSFCDLPVLAPEQVPAPARAETGVIIAIMTLEWKSVARSLMEAGFGSLVSAQRFIVDKMV